MRTLLTMLGAVLALVLPDLAWAGCGLEMCPAVDAAGPAKRSSLRVPIATQLTRYEGAGGQGQIYRADAGVEFWGRDDIVLSAVIPMIVVDADDASGQVGHGNPLGNVQMVSHPISWLSVAGGFLLEVPLGDETLVDDHWVVLNHVQARLNLGRPMVHLRAGYLRTFGGTEGEVGASDGHDHHHDHSTAAHTLPVDPHSDQEARAKAMVGIVLGDWTPALTWDGAIEVQGSSPGTQFHSMGGTIQANLSTRLKGQVQALVPVTQARRYEWRAGLGMTLTR